MLALQFAIGTVNDVVDAPVDRLARADKPVARGLVAPRTALLFAAGCGVGGFAAAASVSYPAAVLAAAGFAIGLAYDVRLKGTTWAWTAFAAGVGLLPIYALWGATGCARPEYAAIFVLALCGGSSLALANALSDLALDQTAGLATVATALGPARTFAVGAGLLAIIEAVVVISLVSGVAAALPLIVAAIAAGVVISWVGAALTWHRPAVAVRAGWEIQAIGLAVTGVAWLAALDAAGVFRHC